MATFVQALLNRGHEVTFLTVQSLNHLNLQNYTEIQVNIPLDAKTQRKHFFFYVTSDKINLKHIQKDQQILKCMLSCSFTGKNG